MELFEISYQGNPAALLIGPQERVPLFDGLTLLACNHFRRLRHFNAGHFNVMERGGTHSIYVHKPISKRRFELEKEQDLQLNLFDEPAGPEPELYATMKIFHMGNPDLRILKNVGHPLETVIAFGGPKHADAYQAFVPILGDRYQAPLLKEHDIIL